MTEPPVPIAPCELGPEVLWRAVRGDDRAFATIVEQYDPLLRQLTFHLLDDPTVVDTLLHTVYLKAYRALPRLRSRTAPGPWVSRIAYQACLDEVRRRNRHSSRVPRRKDPPAEPDAHTIAAPILDDPRLDAFAQALAGLPVDHRAAVILADRAQFDLPTVAEVLGQPEARVARILGRARTVLWAALDEPAQEPDLDVR